MPISSECELNDTDHQGLTMTLNDLLLSASWLQATVFVRRVVGTCCPYMDTTRNLHVLSVLP